MKSLDPKYVQALDEIKSGIQASEHLKSYLEEEDDALYDELKKEFEPKIDELHQQVAQNDPLQLEPLEEALLDDSLEGLFLPRILGYSVLRGSLNEYYKYIRPQEHFKKILRAICNSFNFDILSQRIGQTVEVGFALSSDIWITNLISEVDNKLVKSFLQEHKLSKYSDQRSRHTDYLRYSKQFVSFNFLSAISPKTSPELKIEFKSISSFLLYRASLGSQPGQSVYDYVNNILSTPELGNSEEHLEILLLIGSAFDLQPAEQQKLVERLNAYIKEIEEHEDEREAIFFAVLRRMQDKGFKIEEQDYSRLNAIVSNTNLSEFKTFCSTIAHIDDIGYINTDAIDFARNYHNSNPGLSVQNECLRNVIFGKFERFMSALSEDDFNEYFELNKVFTTYMNAFDNEKFNQQIKGISMKYVKKLLRRFTEKRSKDYQDIKKFVSAVFLDLNFLKEKEIKELFKTKRKKPATA